MPDEGERLQKVLARAGVGSRRTNEMLIAEGRVTVNGEVAVLGRRVDPGRDRVALDGVPVVVDATVVHWVLNKPAGYVTTAHDPHGRPTVLDLVPDEPRVFPVGRLDLETEGLLLLTNDGDLAQLLTHPRHGVEKEYFVEVEGKPSPAALRRLREGVELDDGPTLPARAKIVQESPALTTTALAIVVKEGRKRMVRRMCATVGHPVVRLARTRIGPLRDPHLAPGTWRALATEEVRALYAAALDGAAEASE
jgi:23S rRNA pseudouridine2605 synthase